MSVNQLKKYFPVHKGFFSRVTDYVKAVDDVSFFVNQGEVFGLVGESGCGKTTIGRCVLRLLEPDGGSIIFDDLDLCRLDASELRKKRRDMQIIFQDPYASLNPRMTVGKIIAEGMIIHGIGNRKDRENRTRELLETVGMNPSYINRYPHEFSGGQRQRIGIARALALEPKLIVCDEPVSALDVSIQAQVINLLQDLQERLGLTYLFIAHDLALVKYFSHRVAVMYLGKIMEVASAEDLYTNPLHPYTHALLASVPEPDPGKKSKRFVLEGDVPTPINPPSGCRFHTRCPFRKGREICSREEPILTEISSEHFSACHFSGQM